MLISMELRFGTVGVYVNLCVSNIFSESKMSLITVQRFGGCLLTYEVSQKCHLDWYIILDDVM
jgi:hypothetical protein